MQPPETRLFTRTGTADSGSLFVLTALTVFKDEIALAPQQAIVVTNSKKAREIRIPLNIKQSKPVVQQQQHQQQLPPKQVWRLQ